VQDSSASCRQTSEGGPRGGEAANRIESWWAPDGSEVRVHTLELRPAGELVYDMTATAPEQIRFMQDHVVMQVEALHDDEWTGRLLQGRMNELDNLANVLERRRGS
jgi:hypothetical protein